MNWLSLYFYRYRSILALILSLFVLDLSLSGIILNAVNYWQRDPAPPFAPYIIKTTGRVKMASMEDYLQSILSAVLFKKVPTNGEDPAVNAVTEGVDFEKLGLVLVGTVTGPQWFSRAFIRCNDPGKKSDRYGKAYKIGQRILDGKILWIFRDRVLIRYNGKREYLYLHPRERVEYNGPTGNAVPGNSQSFYMVMTKGQLNKLIFNNLNNILKGLDAGPNLKGSQMDGYKLSKVDSANVLYSLGARSGDIIREVNGHKIDDITKILRLWERVRMEKDIKVALERHGKIVTYNFNIRD